MKAIIFDMDGVLVDSEKVKKKAWEEILESHGAKKGGEWYSKNLGQDGILMGEKAAKEYGLSIEGEKLHEEVYSRYKELANSEFHPIHRSVQFFNICMHKGFKIGVASGDYIDMIEHKLTLLGLIDSVNEIASGVEEVKNNKPAPDVYLLIAKRLGVEPEECLVIEDSKAGIKAAKSAGMKAVGFANPEGIQQDLGEADLVVEDLCNINLEDI